ncbi:MAG TPA: hypothetical protein PLD74_07155 [Prolixibacteraceae bacterium]|nr:hypothetical protein [Prolixibacteraceae bacterium]HOR99217.1 hypothetical protein [Prolixibacteraceae bacterium]HOS90057.1 hypothetical protein [Prolixibacteraceae bacterium]HPL44132.1 hypothetical protein [Prolixibacteraceae bacterium]HQE52127.1 hypothetical protein [Prolixibacteraceae bacterium]
MKRILTSGIVIALLLSIPLLMAGQNTLKLRISGTSTKFMNEAPKETVPHPDFRDLSGGTDTSTGQIGGTITPTIEDFIHNRDLGFEAELMVGLTDKAYVGFEVGRDVMSGQYNNPTLFNFMKTDQFQSTDLNGGTFTGTGTHSITGPLNYNTNMLNFIGNLRIYPAPDGRFKPFIKVSAGMSLISTELTCIEHTLLNPARIDTLSRVIFSRGTPQAPKGREAALVLGGGLGFEFQLTDRIALYADGSYRLVYSDILDGKPDFDWTEDAGSPTGGEMEPLNSRTTISKISFGVVYTLREGYGKSSRSIGGTTSKKSPNLPFYKLKRL